MFSGVPKVLVTVAIAVLGMPSVINAECVKVTPKMWLDAPDSELVFGGKVVEVTDTGEVGSKATFEVERVWRWEGAQAVRCVYVVSRLGGGSSIPGKGAPTSSSPTAGGQAGEGGRRVGRF